MLVEQELELFAHHERVNQILRMIEDMPVLSPECCQVLIDRANAHMDRIEVLHANIV